MRDVEIIRMQQANANRSMLLLRQFEFLATRDEAATTVLRTSRWWMRLWWLLKPADFLFAVDAVQKALIAKRAETLNKTEAKTKIVKPPAAVTAGAQAGALHSA